MDCIWPHHVTKLMGVPPCPVEDLPQTCTCGSIITYSDDLVFISRPISAEVCSTCKEPYSKPSTPRAMFCSNSFHCCRDCVWDWQVEGGFSKGQLVKMCPECKKTHEDNTGVTVRRERNQKVAQRRRRKRK